jgi:hypothetical protein
MQLIKLFSYPLVISRKTQLKSKQFSFYNNRSDFFNFILHNFDSFLDISDQNFQLSLNFFNSSLDALQSRFITFWICAFIVILLCYLFIYPIILKTKITIHETLRIFTKISMRDVDHYSDHYKKIFFFLKTIHDSSDLITKIDDEIA